MKNIFGFVLFLAIIFSGCTSNQAANMTHLEDGSDERRNFINEYEQRERDYENYKKNQ